MPRTDIDFANSRAILLGTSRYTAGFGRTPMPAAANSVDALHDALSGPCGWPAARITRLTDQSSGRPVLARIAPLIHEAGDVLIFYYVGHGQLLVGNDLGLALTDTSEDPRLRLSTSLPLSHVRQEIEHNCDARVRILVLDCCCSGIATRYAQGPAALADKVRQAAAFEGEGTYTWTACGHSQDTFYEPGDSGLTYFTKFIVSTVGRGIASPAAGLTVSDLHREVKRRFRTEELPDVAIRPEPSLLFRGASDEFVFVGNAGRTAPRSERRAEPAPVPDEPPALAPEVIPLDIPLPKGPRTVIPAAAVSVHFREAADRHPAGTLAPQTLLPLEGVDAAACARVRGALHAVVLRGASAEVWNLTAGTHAGTLVSPVPGETFRAVACGVQDAVPRVVTLGSDGTDWYVRVWSAAGVLVPGGSFRLGAEPAAPLLACVRRGSSLLAATCFAAGGQGRLHLLDLADGSVEMTLAQEVDGTPESLAAPLDGTFTTLATVQRGRLGVTATVWDLTRTVTVDRFGTEVGLAPGRGRRDPAAASGPAPSRQHTALLTGPGSPTAGPVARRVAQGHVDVALSGADTGGGLGTAIVKGEVRESPGGPGSGPGMREWRVRHPLPEGTTDAVVSQVDGREVVVSCTGDRLTLTDARSAVRLPSLGGHPTGVRFLAHCVVDGAPVIVSAWNDGSLRTWSLDQPALRSAKNALTRREHRDGNRARWEERGGIYSSNPEFYWPPVVATWALSALGALILGLVLRHVVGADYGSWGPRLVKYLWWTIAVVGPLASVVAACYTLNELTESSLALPAWMHTVRWTSPRVILLGLVLDLAVIGACFALGWYVLPHLGLVTVGRVLSGH